MEANRQPLERHVVARLVRVSDVLPAQLQIELNPTDRARAARFRQAEDRARFLTGRALLGTLLAHYLGAGARIADLAWTAGGRPVLFDYPNVQFSISHSRDLVAVALSTGALVGLDVECVERELDFDGLAERIFSKDDLKSFQALPKSARPTAFFRAWTGKEAVLKARGVGLFGGLKEVSVDLEDDSTVTRLKGPDDAASPSWLLHLLPLPAGYAGQVAWDDPRKELDFREMKLDETP